MKVLIQRVSSASVEVDGLVVGKIGRGLLILVGIAQKDSQEQVDWIAEKCINLRIFEDDQGKMNRSLQEDNGEILAVSQFTLLADTQKGRRPSYINAADPQKGKLLYNQFVQKLRNYNIKVETGVFGAMMDVKLVNQGPVTLMIEKVGTLK